MTRSHQYDHEAGDFPSHHPELEDEVDPAVIARLPVGAAITDAIGYGASYWTRTARIDCTLPEGEEKSFFLKVAEGDNGYSMMRGEFESIKAIHKFSPEFVPRPIAWGTFELNSDMHFMLSEFREMDQEVPEMERTCQSIADLHLRSHGEGMKKFGYHVTTHNGRLPQDCTWTDTWEECFVNQFKGMLELEEESQGPQTEEMKEVVGKVFEKVIPRLLRPMERHGNSITPSLLHGDFWHGNVSTDVDTGDPVTYDSSAFWGHNEYDIRMMTKRARYKFGQNWLREYLRHYAASLPAIDFEARSELYRLRSKCHESASFPGNGKNRQSFIDHARALVEAYPDGYEGWLEKNGLQEGKS